jgi:hypothetical protein
VPDGDELNRQLAQLLASIGRPQQAEGIYLDLAKEMTEAAREHRDEPDRALYYQALAMVAMSSAFTSRVVAQVSALVVALQEHDELVQNGAAVMHEMAERVARIEARCPGLKGEGEQ